MEDILRIKNLKVSYGSGSRRVNALRGIDISLASGECAGVVGESGCGKSTLAFAIMGIIDRAEGKVDSGEVNLKLPAADTVDLAVLAPEKLRRIRGRYVSLIMQDPYGYLNPVIRIGEQMKEAYYAHNGGDESEMEKKVKAGLREVTLPDDDTVLRAYPHQLSGGMLQRVGIATALLNSPQLLIADEPTSNLDVTIQKKIIQNIVNIREKSGLSMIFITHNLNLVAGIADKIYILYAGNIVEYGPCREIFKNPMHPYTRGLIGALPSILEPGRRIIPIPGSVPAAGVDLHGCAFASRCSLRTGGCLETIPEYKVSGDHYVKCVNSS